MDAEYVKGQQALAYAETRNAIGGTCSNRLDSDVTAQRVRDAEAAVVEAAEALCDAWGNGPAPSRKSNELLRAVRALHAARQGVQDA